MPTSTINRTIFWNRRRVGDLGGRVGINQDLKRLVMYSVEPTAKNIYIMNYSSGAYSKPSVPLIVLDNSQDWDVSYTEINDVLLINCSNENQARLFITFDDYAFEVKYPDLAPVEVEVIPSEISEGQAGLDPLIPKGEVKGIVCEVDKYIGIMYAIRLTDGSHVRHSLPYFHKLDIGSPGSGNVIVNKLSFTIDRDYMVINDLYKKVIDGVSVFITIPYKNIQDTISSGVYHKVGNWDVDYIIGETPVGSTVLMEYSEEQIISFEVLEIDPFSHHSLAGRYTQNYNEILMLGGVFTNFGFPPKYKPLNGSTPLSELGLNGVYDLVTIKVGNSEYFRLRKNTYYEGTDNTKIVVQKFISYPDRRATRQRSYYYNPGDGDYELIADIPLKPHPALNLAYSYVDPSTAILGVTKDSNQTIGPGTGLVEWVGTEDDIVIAATGIYTIRVTLMITSASTFTNPDLVNMVVNADPPINMGGVTAVGTHEFLLTGRALNAGDIVRIQYVEDNSTTVSVNIGSSYSVNGNVTPLGVGSEFTIGGQYLIPNIDRTDYIASGESITLGSLDFTVNNQNLVELNKIRVSDAIVVKFPIERTYELGDNSQNNEIVSILVNTNDISQGQFGQFPIYVFSRNRIYGLEISQSPGVLFSRIITIFSDFGLQNRDAAVPFNGSVIFISPRGIHTLSGSKVEDIHFPIQDHWLYSFLVGTPTAPVQNSKLALNHKRNELYFFNEEMDSAFCYSLQYGVWFTFDHITEVQHVMYDEQFPYLVCPDKIYNMEDLSSDKVEIKLITNAYKLGDKRVYKKVKHNYLRGNLYRDDTDEFILKLRAARGISRLVDLATYDLQNTGKEELSDAILRNHWGSFNFFALELRGQLFPSSRIISWDIDYETRYDHRLRSAMLLPDLPETPTNLVADDNGSFLARATWTNVATNATNIEVWLKIEERTGVDTYVDFQAYTRVALLGPGATTYTYPTLPVQGRYTFKVRAINGTAQSDFSNEDNVLLFVLAPENVVATAGIGEIDLTWTNPSVYDNLLIRYSLNSDLSSPTEIDLGDGTATSYTITGLDDSTEYYAVVVGVKGSGEVVSEIVSATTFNPFIITVKTDNAGTSANNQFILPLTNSAATSNVNVYLVSDGSLIASNVTTASPTITFPAGAGTYEIAITGTLGGWKFNNGSDKLKVTEWSRNGIFSGLGATNNPYESAWYGCTNLEYTATDELILAGSCNQFFRNCSTLTATGSSIGDWNMSGVTDIDRFFLSATLFNADIDNWDVSNCDGMFAIFNNATAFNQSLNSWNLASLTDMERAFENATAFNGNISSWNVSGVNSLQRVFNGASAFNQDISGWNVSNVTNLNQTFEGASAFNQSLNIWDVSVVTLMQSTFKNATAFNGNISSWNVSGVTSFFEFLRGASAFNQDISGWNVNTATSVSSMFRLATSFNQDISGWTLGQVTSFALMLNGASTFDQNLSGWANDLVNGRSGGVPAMSACFDNCGISTSNYDAMLQAWDVVDLIDNVTFGASGLNYTAGGAAEAARTSIITNDSWTITDAGGI